MHSSENYLAVPMDTAYLKQIHKSIPGSLHTAVSEHSVLSSWQKLRDCLILSSILQ